MSSIVVVHILNWAIGGIHGEVVASEKRSCGQKQHNGKINVFSANFIAHYHLLVCLNGKRNHKFGSKRKEKIWAVVVKHNFAFQVEELRGLQEENGYA